jgi:DNA-binding transcriptional regulator PaaX
MKKQERQEMILNIILGVGVLTTAIVAPNALQLFKYFHPKSRRGKWEIKRSFLRLEKKGFVKKKITNGEDYYTLTLLGSERAKKYKLDSMKIEHQKKWDKKWRLIMFDIPEDKKMARRGINLVLKKLGCVQYQKSVFITPFPCKKEIDFVGECFGVRKYIRVITADEVEGVEPLKKVFKL